MKSFADSERFVEYSERIVLECHGCGEALILLGREEDWRLERTSFECHCGEQLTLVDRRDEGVLTPEEDRAARDLLRGLRIRDLSS